MISNTELLYLKAKDFQDERAKIVKDYEQKLKTLERFKGSKGYEEDLKKLNNQTEKALSELADVYRPSLYTILGSMMDAIGRRAVNAPTTDQVNLLSVLKMKKKVTLEECQRTAEAVKDNPMAVSVVNEIAHDHGIMRFFDDVCSEMSSQDASEIVKGLKDGMDDFLLYDTTKASRLINRYHSEHYGAGEDALIKRKLFNSQSEFYSENGLEGETLKQFSDIVNA